MLGATGAGKTTTINLFLNFIKPTSGHAFIGDKDVAQESLETKKLLAYIPENLMLYPNLTGMGNLDYFPDWQGKAIQEINTPIFFLKLALTKTLTPDD